jgi:hypothetical protein
MADLLAAARCAVYENVRHSHDSLFALLGMWHKEATDEQIDEAVSQVLG